MVSVLIWHSVNYPSTKLLLAQDTENKRIITEFDPWIVDLVTFLSTKREGLRPSAGMVRGEHICLDPATDTALFEVVWGFWTTWPCSTIGVELSNELNRSTASIRPFNLRR